MSSMIERQQSSHIAWQPAGFRFSAFPAPEISIESGNWWSSLVGEAPENVSSQPRTGEKIEEGEYGNGRLVLSTQTARIDWYYTVAQDPATALTSIPVLGPLDEQLNFFQKTIQKWLKNTELVLQRLAFGSELFFPVASQIEGYSTLKRLIPVDIDEQHTSDFLYQINRKRDSVAGITDLKINRLSKWSVSRIEQNLLLLPINRIQRAKLLACRLELDINTSPEFDRELSGQQISALFDELISLGREIAEKGDVK